MKIKLAILERDKSYLTRVVSVFSTKYSEKLETYSFTDPDVAFCTLKSAKIDILLASDSYEINPDLLPSRCAFAYLVDSVGIETVNNQRAICKFQKVDQIYKQILSVYAEKASSITGFKASNDDVKIIAFGSAGGGVGSSTLAAACAMHFATQDQKVLYLNLEKFGSSDVFFSGQGQFSMSDVIFALKSKKTNLPLKLEGCVRQDQSGVYFYSASKIALDMMELNIDDICRLISELKLTGGYDAIILDLDFDIDKDMLTIYRQAQTIVLVGDGSVESNTKTERAVTALMTIGQNDEDPLVNRISFVYNKVSSKNGQSISIQGLRVLGGAPRYTGAEAQQIVEQLSKMELFDIL